MQYKTLIIDGPYLAHRSYSAPYRLNTSKNINSTLVHSFLTTLLSLKKQFEPIQTIIAWESHGTKSWRREQYKPYKPQHKLESDFVSQQEDVKTLLSYLGYEQYYSPNNEADDVIAKLTSKPKPIVIFTTDKDIMQLVDQNCHVFNGKKIYDKFEVIKKFGVSPNQISDFLAITGDISDNIPGVKNYGPKKTAKAIKEFGLVEKIPHTHSLNKYKQQILYNKRLTQLNKNCDLKEYKPNKTQTMYSILDKYELRRIEENINKYKEVNGKEPIKEWI